MMAKFSVGEICEEEYGLECGGCKYLFGEYQRLFKLLMEIERLDAGEASRIAEQAYEPRLEKQGDKV